MKISFKTRETHFSSLLLLDPLLIQVLNIVVDLVLSIPIPQVMMADECKYVYMKMYMPMCTSARVNSSNIKKV